MEIRGCQFSWLVAVGGLALVSFGSVRAESPSSKKPLALPAPIRFVSPGQFAYDQLLRPLLRTTSEGDLNQVAMPARHDVARSSLPLKQITLLGGDRLTAEILRWDETEVELRMQDHKFVVPRMAIVDVQTPRGERDVFYESFDQSVPESAESTVPVKRPAINGVWLENPDPNESRRGLNIGKAVQPVRYGIPQPFPGSRIQVWFRVGGSGVQSSDSDRAKSDAALSIEFDGTEKLIVQATKGEASASTSGAAERSITRQTVALNSGWHCLTALLHQERAVVIVDQSLLWSANRSLGPLGEVCVSGQGSVWIDDLQVSQFETVTNTKAPCPSTEDDCLVLHGGEELFGRISQVTAAGVRLTDSTGERLFAWSQVVGFALRQTDQVATRSLSPIGLSAVIELQAPLDRPQQATDRLDVMVVHNDRDFVVVVHPWLGRFAIPWNRIARIIPQFFGQSMTLDARRRHLGDAIRDDFQRQMPDGTEWSVKFPLPSQARLMEGQLWLVLDVVDLEPAGLQTPPGSPFLREMRAGQLLTKISINNQPAGDLNRWIQYRATPDRPERIRCLLPKELRVGENVIRLHQIPLKSSGSRFDNCELSNLRLEIVEPVR